MDMQTGRSVLGAHPELIDQFAAIDDAAATVADVLIAIEDMDGQSPVVMSLARVARAYLGKVGAAKVVVLEACNTPLPLASVPGIARVGSHDGGNASQPN